MKKRKYKTPYQLQAECEKRMKILKTIAEIVVPIVASALTTLLVCHLLN